LFGDIHGRPDEAFESHTVNHRNSDATYVTNLPIGSHNPHNVVKATINALEGLRDKGEIAEMRGLALDKVR
jgi:hypothetical protein